MEKAQIYVEVLGFPGGALIPTSAEHFHGNPDLEHDYWRFEAPDLVRCVEHQFAEGETGWLATGPCRCNAEWETTADPTRREELPRDYLVCTESTYLR